MGPRRLDFRSILGRCLVEAGQQFSRHICVFFNGQCQGFSKKFLRSGGHVAILNPVAQPNKRLHQTAASFRGAAGEPQRYTDRAQKTSDRFSAGQVGDSRRVSRRVAGSPDAGNVRRPGKRGRSPISSWQRATPGASGCCDRWDWSHHVGVGREASGSLGLRRVAGVRTRGHRARARSTHGVVHQGSSFRTSSVFVTRRQCPQSVAGAPPSGASRCRGALELSGSADCSFERPYNQALEPTTGARHRSEERRGASVAAQRER